MARIFLCHASEDKAQVREVYHQLNPTATLIRTCFVAQGVMDAYKTTFPHH